MRASFRRYVLLAAAASVAVLAGGLLMPAAADAQTADTPVTPAITLVLTPPTADYGHQSVAASGTVTTSAGPLAGATITVGYMDIAQQFAQISLKTGSDGRYSGTIPDPETAAQTVTATVAATSSTSAASASAQLGFTTDPVTIAASFDQPSVNALSTDTLSGFASYTSEGSSSPLANTTLTITSPGSFNWPAVSTTVTTGADGSFSYVTPEIYLAVNSVEFTVSSAATPTLKAGQVSLSLPVNQQADLVSFHAHLTAAHVLGFSVCGGIPDPLADSLLTTPVDLQYSAGRHGRWKTLGVSNDQGYNGPCWGATEGGTYTGTFTAPLANGYYRAYAPAVPYEMSGVSRVIHLQRYPTRISGFAISPRGVSHGQVTVSGRLWQRANKWLPAGNATITIEYRYRGKTYALKHRLMTNSAGQFRGVFAVPHSAVWQAVYGGGRDRFAAASRPLRITVR